MKNKVALLVRLFENVFFFSFFPTFDSPSPYDDEFKKSQFFSKNCDINHLHTPEWHLHIMIQIHGYSLRRKAPHSLSILIRVKPWVIVIRVNQWLEKRLASIYILGLQSEAVYDHVITQFSWMGRLPHFLSYGALKRRAWSSMPFHFIHVYTCIFPKKKRWRPNQFRSEYN